jgi:hypothetical protein
MFRTALILLALALAACVQEPMRQPTAIARSVTAEAARNQTAGTPVAISCDVPGPKPRPILVPVGRNPTDFCPADAISYHYTPGVIYLLPATDVPLPPTKHAGQQTSGQPP